MAIIMVAAFFKCFVSCGFALNICKIHGCCHGYTNLWYDSGDGLCKHHAQKSNCRHSSCPGNDISYVENNDFSFFKHSGSQTSEVTVNERAVSWWSPQIFGKL